ncbi:MAG: hypothetical protein H8E66_10030 [Planctomycetes bacterium]|nr:hypothetical protein [Planctomycetota bacterium]MBL7038947.1 hypothetical protein [Pirellulaceae bacterium]
MKPIDFAKATGVAVALLAVNLLIAVAVVVFYRFVVEPGHPSEFYDAAALRISPWCSHIAGTALFFGAGLMFTKWRPVRNGFLFAATFTVSYAIIDAAMVGFSGMFDVEFALSMFAKLAAALAGAFVMRSRTQSTGDEQ